MEKHWLWLCTEDTLTKFRRGGIWWNYLQGQICWWVPFSSFLFLKLFYPRWFRTCWHCFWHSLIANFCWGLTSPIKPSIADADSALPHLERGLSLHWHTSKHLVLCLSSPHTPACLQCSRQSLTGSRTMTSPIYSMPTKVIACPPRQVGRRPDLPTSVATAVKEICFQWKHKIKTQEKMKWSGDKQSTR